MAKRSLDQLDRAEALETPPKQPRPRPKSETAQESTKALLMEMQQNVPTLAGRVADFLWHDLDDVRQVGKLAPVQELLLSGREMQLQVMVPATWDCLQLRPDDKVLDLATGTADVSILVGQHLRQLGARGTNAVLGVDPSNEMLRRGVVKVQDQHLEHVVRLVKGDAQDLREVQVIDAEGTLGDKSPGSREASVDKISMSFGIRNVPDRSKALSEMRRVLRPSEQSRVCILELSLPTGDTFLSKLARKFITEVVPFIGWVATMGSGGEEYEYLERSILRFPKPMDFAAELAAAGLPVETITSFAYGAVNLYTAKPAL